MNRKVKDSYLDGQVRQREREEERERDTDRERKRGSKERLEKEME